MPSVGEILLTVAPYVTGVLVALLGGAIFGFSKQPSEQRTPQKRPERVFLIKRGWPEAP
jgi:hypothetical protein